MRILVYGYGNPGRQDDGLGIALVDRLETWAADEKLTGISFENNYQLNIEDAEAISHQDLVVFADASEEDIEDFCLSEVDGTGKMSFTTHAASPSYIVKLCQELFDRSPRVLLLHIKGYAWNFQEELTDPARKNLDIAFDWMKTILKNPQTALDSKEEIKLC
jgi:hydrogenase maturation protease